MHTAPMVHTGLPDPKHQRNPTKTASIKTRTPKRHQLHDVFWRTLSMRASPHTARDNRDIEGCLACLRTAEKRRQWSSKRGQLWSSEARPTPLDQSAGWPYSSQGSLRLTSGAFHWTLPSEPRPEDQCKSRAASQCLSLIHI